MPFLLHSSTCLASTRHVLALQVAVKRAEAAKWQVMQEANASLQSQQQRMQSEIQEWKARYRDEAAYSNELQAADNRLQTELTAAQLEAKVQFRCYRAYCLPMQGMYSVTCLAMQGVTFQHAGCWLLLVIAEQCLQTADMTHNGIGL